LITRGGKYARLCEQSLLESRPEVDEAEEKLAARDPVEPGEIENELSQLDRQ
jgi:hypothetical protein